jgi:hypothetical protein
LLNLGSLLPAISTHARPITLPAMAEHLKVAVDHPIKVFALGPECPREAVAGLGVVRWRISIVSIVLVVLVASQILAFT